MSIDLILASHIYKLSFHDARVVPCPLPCILDHDASLMHTNTYEDDAEH